MNKKLAAVGVLVLASLTLLAFSWDRRLQANLPPKEVYPSKDEAFIAAFRDNANIHRPIVVIAGTGSMAPYIKADPSNPTAPVAFAIIDPEITYDTIQVGQLGMYKALYKVSIDGASVIHILAERRSDGLVFTGLANQAFETRTLVDRDHFIGAVKKVYTW